MPHSRILLCTAAAVALAVSPAAAQGVIATGSGRAGATVAALVALLGVGTGGFAATRTAGRSGRDGAIVAQVLGVVGLCLAGLHLATANGGIGTGNGRLGAIVAVVLGGVALALGRLALVRSSRR